MSGKRLIEEIDLNTARKVPINQAKEYEVIPLYEKEDTAYIATSDDSERGKEFLTFLFGKRIKFLKHGKDEIMNLINVVLDYDYKNIEQKIFKEAIESKASDIHYELVDGALNIRFRINGALILVRKLMLEEYSQITSRLKVGANLDITEKRRPQDGKIFMMDGEVEYNCRLSTIPVVGGEKLVLRILYEEKFLSDIRELNFTVEQLRTLEKIIKLSSGLIICNGPTGSGKSTTMYTILNMIKRDEINITTLEDPIEIKMDGINQINLNQKIGITFARGLRSILRQDPDVIMIGEIRDEETAKMAVRASITGHKVYSTIHTKSAREVYLRLEEMGVKDYLIRDALGGIISQRLIRLICDRCKEKSGEIDLNGSLIGVYRKKGCIICNGTGYTGRTLVASVNYIDKFIREKLRNIYENEDLLSNKQMLEGVNRLLLEGKIDYEDYLGFIEGEELFEE
ncbi:GspE/PulE family protein [Clostridium paraputrificum]|uniref:GspE/PulE family protein n=1 Tax=Clostridium paraputrificum TaxID=29363 RepID=UPI003D332ADB